MLLNLERQRPVTDLQDDSSAEQVIAWALNRFPADRIVTTTGFGMEGCALIDMLARGQRPLNVVYIDTGFLFSETYALRDRLAQRFPHVTFRRQSPTLTPEEQAARHGDALWRRDPDRCCQMRKVEPLSAALADADVWITAITKSQSAERAGTQPVAWDERHNVYKVTPLAAWTRQRVWEYVREHNVPYNPLHERGYPSIGCMQCTTKVEGIPVTGYSREGRWASQEKTECGLHFTPNGRMLRRAV